MSKTIFDKLIAFSDHFVYLIMADSRYFMKLTTLRAFSVPFKYFAGMLKT